MLKIEKKYKKYILYYTLLIAQDLWQAIYQILSIIFLKEFIKLNANTKMMVKGVQFSEINISIATSFPEYTNFKDDLIEHKFLCCKKNYQ